MHFLAGLWWGGGVKWAPLVAGVRWRRAETRRSAGLTQQPQVPVVASPEACNVGLPTGPTGPPAPFAQEPHRQLLPPQRGQQRGTNMVKRFISCFTSRLS